MMVIAALLQSSPENIGGGLGIALVGMTTVFIGLVVLAFTLPALKSWVKNRFGLDRKNPHAGQSSEETLTQEEIAAVSAAIHVHFCFLDQVENMKLTWETYERPYSPWRLAGRTEHLQESGSLQNRVRSR